MGDRTRNVDKLLCRVSYVTGTVSALADVLTEAASRLTAAEMLALGIPLNDPEAFRAFGIEHHRVDPFFSTRGRKGECGRPSLRAAALAVVVAAARQNADGTPAKARHAAAAKRLGVTAACVRNAPENLRQSLRRHSADVGADVLADRRETLIAEAARVLADVEREAAGALARTRAERRQSHHAGNPGLFMSA